MEQLTPAASALIINKGRVLLVRSNTTQEQWAFPGGKQEENETPQQTVSREIKEELGIDIEIKMELGSFVYAAGNRRYEIRCFVAEARSLDLRADPGEIIEARWCTLRKSLDLNLTSTTREALEKYTSRRLILASTSPRRRELLEKLGCSFQVESGGVEEESSSAASPAEHVSTLALRKALGAASGVKGAVVVAADTVVVLDGLILEKPGTPERAREMLVALSGNEHQVVTGLAVVDADSGTVEQDVVTTRVRFRHLGEELIGRYVATGEPLDKAGAYAIQGRGALLVDSIEGCYYNVVGLPLSALSRLLEKFGMDLF